MKIDVTFPYAKSWNGKERSIERENGKTFVLRVEDMSACFSVKIQNKISNNRVDNLIRLDDASYTLMSFRNWNHDYLTLEFEIDAYDDNESEDYDEIIEKLSCEGTVLSGEKFTSRESDYAQFAEYCSSMFILSLNFCPF